MPRIVSDSPDGIIIEDRPIALAAILGIFLLLSVFMVFDGLQEGDTVPVVLGVAFAALLWIVIAKAIRRVRLDLDPGGGARLTVRSLGGTTIRTFPPGTLRAGLATDYTDGTTHRVILLVDTDAGLERLPLTTYLGGSGSHEMVANCINRWAAAS